MQFRWHIKQETKMSTKGLTLIELLIVIAILAVLFLALLVSLVGQTERAHDAERKSDLEHIKIAFEDYYNDNKCYPPAGSLNECGSAQLKPYLASIPCDPVTNSPYYYEPLENQCAGYRLYAQLAGDPQPSPLVAEECLYHQFNYLVTVGAIGLPSSCPSIMPSPDVSPSPTMIASPTPAVSPSPSSVSSPTPSPTPTPSPLGIYACDRQGICNEYDDPQAAGCGQIYVGRSNCNDECDQVPIELRCNY